MINNFENIPKHIAIIMDGNRRWAKEKGLSVSIGHKTGADILRRIVTHAYDIGVEYLTVYAFSTENWNRKEKEVSDIMKIIYEFTKEELKRKDDRDICIRIYGDKSKLSDKLKNNLEKLEQKTISRKRLVFGICLNYGGREEVISSIKNICNEIVSGNIKIDEIDYKTISENLYTGNILDPDLVIRTSGEKRLSNFLPLQTVYSELYFTDVFWPDFDESEFEKAIGEYKDRKRRYGK